MYVYFDTILLQAMRDIFDQYLPILIVEVNSGCNFKVSDTLNIKTYNIIIIYV